MTHIDLDKKRIIIYIPDHVGLPEMFRENLELLGLTVYAVTIPNPKNRISVKDLVVHNFRKIFKSDRTHKKNVLAKNWQQDIIQTNVKILNKINGKTDYALAIRPDLLPDDVLKEIKKSTRKMVGYQWDGLNRFPAVYTKIHFFDQFFVFDKKDISADNKCKLITNFYFDHLLGQGEVPNTDVFFIGSYVDSRMKSLTEIALFLKNNGFIVDINVVGNPAKYILPSSITGINHTTEIFDFKKNYQHIKKTKAILDLLDDAHTGLSLRIFEAIGFKKKLITNNLEVKKYEFYNPNNIFIIGERNLEDIPDFIQKPFEDLPADIHRKYSFENWLRNVLDIPEYITIYEQNENA